MSRLDQLDFRGALGIVDDDFDDLQGRNLASLNLVGTGVHDLECLLLRSAALDSILLEFGDPKRIDRFEKAECCTVRDALLARGLPFGRLRWLAHRTGWTGSRDQLRPTQRFVDEKTWQVNHGAVYAVAVQQGLASTAEALAGAIASLPEADPWLVCQGHDLIAILRIGLRSVIGASKSDVSHEVLAGLLRQSCDRADLDQMHLGQAIRTWEQRNPPYRVLPRA